MAHTPLIISLIASISNSSPFITRFFPIILSGFSNLLLLCVFSIDLIIYFSFFCFSHILVISAVICCVSSLVHFSPLVHPLYLLLIEEHSFISSKNPFYDPPPLVGIRFSWWRSVQFPAFSEHFLRLHECSVFRFNSLVSCVCIILCFLVIYQFINRL